jgi:hypothetical protein
MFQTINTNLALKHYAFPSIGQFANVVASVNRKSTYVGRDADDEPIYDKFAAKPTLKFIGTTKLHGTNAGVILDFYNNTIYFESRESVIAPGNDNAGFATYMSSIQEHFADAVINNLGLKDTCWHPDNKEDGFWNDHVLAIYGEWCGGSIQKGVAINGLEKMFVIFNATIRTRENTESRNLDWFPVEEIKKMNFKNITLLEKKVFNIYDFKTWELEIDFEKFHESINQIVDNTIKVEEECPFAKEFGSIGIGEGIVYICTTPGFNNSDFWFKSKGEKHANSKVKTLKPVDDAKINRMIEISNRVTPAWRLEQMFNQTFDTINGGIVTTEKLGDYIKAVNNDICKEETLLMEQEGIQFKDIAKYVSTITRDYFKQIQHEMLTNPQ